MNVTFSWGGTSARPFYTYYLSDIDLKMNVNIRHPRTGGGEGREQISDGVPLLLPASRHWLRHSLQFPGRGLYQI